MQRWSAALSIVLGLAMSSPGEAQTSRGAALPLRVGASKVDVTPSGSELPKNGFGILDHLYARAIVLDNGAAAAALVTVDALRFRIRCGKQCRNRSKRTSAFPRPT